MVSKIGKVIVLLVVVIGGIFGIYLYALQGYPDTLPLGQDPSLLLPLNDYTHNDYIGGYGETMPGKWHGGFDFGVNDTTAIIAPCNSYVSFVQLNWFNDLGGHWQSNINLRLNDEWEIRLPFESWTTDQTTGQLQAVNILVKRGDYVEAGQILGYLLCHGDSAHLHYGLVHFTGGGEEEVCIYPYLTSSSQTFFEFQFALVGTTSEWCT